MEAQVTFLEAPVVGAPASFILNGRQMVSSPVLSVEKDSVRHGWFFVSTASGSVYGGMLAPGSRFPAVGVEPAQPDKVSELLQIEASQQITCAIYISAKSRMTAGLLGIFLGIVGAHKFYLGQWRPGLVYLALCWTLIPAVIGLIEGISCLCMSDEDFLEKYG